MAATTNHINEKDLLLQLRDGDHRAFNHIYHKYSAVLIANLIRLLKNDMLVDEVMQETFMTLWEKRANIDPDKQVDGYLFRISANKVKNIFKRAVHDIKMRKYFYPIIEAGYEQIETELFRKENEELLHDLLQKLPPKQREVYTLCKLRGMTYREVSKMLNISESTINSHILRANNLLKKELAANPGIAYILLISILAM